MGNACHELCIWFVEPCFVGIRYLNSSTNPTSLKVTDDKGTEMWQNIIVCKKGELSETLLWQIPSQNPWISVFVIPKLDYLTMRGEKYTNKLVCPLTHLYLDLYLI